MRRSRLFAGVVLVFGFIPIITATAFGQVKVPQESLGGPLTESPVIGAPFSAEATTILNAVLEDGTRFGQSTTDRYYRDAAGRVRIEKLFNGLPAAETMSERHIRTVIDPDPGDGWVYTLDAQTRTARYAGRSSIAATAGGARWFAVPVGGVRFVNFLRAGDLASADPETFADVREESLGSRRIAGLDTTGRRITIVVPRGYRRNDEPIEITDERWESHQLKLIVQSSHSDGRNTIEYRLSNISLADPPARLFQLPPDYTMDYSSTSKDPIISTIAVDKAPAADFRGRRKH